MSGVVFDSSLEFSWVIASFIEKLGQDRGTLLKLRHALGAHTADTEEARKGRLYVQDHWEEFLGFIERGAS